MEADPWGSLDQLGNNQQVFRVWGLGFKFLDEEGDNQPVFARATERGRGRMAREGTRGSLRGVFYYITEFFFL